MAELQRVPYAGVFRGFVEIMSTFTTDISKISSLILGIAGHRMQMSPASSSLLH